MKQLDQQQQLDQQLQVDRQQLRLILVNLLIQYSVPQLRTLQIQCLIPVQLLKLHTQLLGQLPGQHPLIEIQQKVEVQQRVEQRIIILQQHILPPGQRVEQQIIILQQHTPLLGLPLKVQQQVEQQQQVDLRIIILQRLIQQRGRLVEQQIMILQRLIQQRGRLVGQQIMIPQPQELRQLVDLQQKVGVLTLYIVLIEIHQKVGVQQNQGVRPLRLILVEVLQPQGLRQRREQPLQHGQLIEQLLQRLLLLEQPLQCIAQLRYLILQPHLVQQQSILQVLHIIHHEPQQRMDVLEVVIDKN